MRWLLAIASVLAVIVGLTSCTLDLGGDDDDGAGSGNPCGGFTGQQCDADEWCDYVTDDCGIADGSGTCRARPLACADIYLPVRGADGEIYGNACEAHASGVDDCGPVER